MFEFRLLGPLEVAWDRETITIRGEKQRAVLACLLIDAGRPVTADALVESIWGPEAEPRAGHSLHEVVSKLRRTLAEHGLEGIIETPSAGSYLLKVDEERVDARRFENLAKAAFETEAPEARSELLREALDLWRGPALVDVVLGGNAADERERLDALRVATMAEWIDVETLLGRHAPLIPELTRLTAAHPVHERFREQLMLALYREGRQAEALREYQQTRAFLADELGLEPSERLRDLERAILRQDPALSVTRRSAVRVARTPSRWTRRRAYSFSGVAAVVVAATALLFGLKGREAQSAVLFDSLRGVDLDHQLWDASVTGTGLTISPTVEGVRLTVTSHAAPTDASGVMKAHLTTYCWIAGPFDIQVDYRLHTWPRANGVSVGMYAAYANVVRKSDVVQGEVYIGTVAEAEPPDRPPHKRLPTSDTSGTLRLIRNGDGLEEQVRTGGHWRVIYVEREPYGFPASVYLEVWTNRQRFAHRHVDVEFSNFRVNIGTITCLPGASSGCCGT